MNPVDVAVLAVTLTAHLTASVYAYLDAPDHGMDARRWGLRALVVPVFGFFAYLFERDERRREEDGDDREEMFSDGVFEIHESRADDAGFAKGSGKHDSTDEE
ncbi:MAG: hypothetical protein ACLFSW_02170 [Halobacteriales archaeon]